MDVDFPQTWVFDLCVGGALSAAKPTGAQWEDRRLGRGGSEREGCSPGIGHYGVSERVVTMQTPDSSPHEVFSIQITNPKTVVLVGLVQFLSQITAEC